jgi:opacity protein-like surface antigen
VEVVREVFMRFLTRVLSIGAVALLLPALAAAQRMPREGGSAVFGGLGISNPTDEDFDADIGFSGGFEYFLTRNFSLGALGGAWKSDVDFGDDAKEAYVDFIAAYNWEGGRLHPYVQGGLGAYFVDFPFGDSDTEFGGFVGGGLDIFFARSAAIDIALRYHIVPDIDIGFDNELDAKFFEAHAGVKFYF